MHIYIVLLFLSSSTIIGHSPNYPIQHSLPSIFLSPSFPATHSSHNLHLVALTDRFPNLAKVLPFPRPRFCVCDTNVFPTGFFTSCFNVPNPIKITFFSLSVLPINDLIHAFVVFFLVFCFFRQFGKV